MFNISDAIQEIKKNEIQTYKIEINMYAFFVHMYMYLYEYVFAYEYDIKNIIQTHAK